MPLSITYENWTADDLEHGDTDDRGYLYEDTDLWTFVQALGRVEDVERTFNGARLYCTSFVSDYAAGVLTQYTGHIKGTPSTVERILRVLRAKHVMS